FGEPGLRRLALSAFAYAGCQVCVSAFFVIYLADGIGMPLVRAGLIFAVVQVGGIGGRILWGAVAERLLSSRAVLVLLGVLMAGGCAATAAFAPDWPLAGM